MAIGATNPDLVILDMEMPGMHGLDICKKLLQNNEFSNTNIVVITGYLNKYLDDLTELGIKNIIEKPFKVFDLQEKLLPLLENI